MIAVGAAIGASGQLGAALRALAGKIESAVGANFGVSIHFRVALGAGKDYDGQRGAAIAADIFVFQREAMAFGANERTASRTRFYCGLKARAAVGAHHQFRNDDRSGDFPERRPGQRGLLRGQGVVTVGALDRGGVDRALAMRARSGKQPIARGTDRGGGEQLKSAVRTIEEEFQSALGATLIRFGGGGQTARTESGPAGAAQAILEGDQRAARGAPIAFAGRCVAEDHAAVGTFRGAIRYFVLAFRAVQDKSRATLRANERVGLQGRAAGRAPLTFALGADVGGVRHRLPAVRAGFKFFFERQAAMWTFCIVAAELMSTFRASKRPGLATLQASGGAGWDRLVTLGAKFLAAVIADLGIARKFG